MKTLQEDTTKRNGMVDLEVRSKVPDSDEKHNAPSNDSLSLFGPCCSDGCQYCHPNCFEHLDNSNYF